MMSKKEDDLRYSCLSGKMICVIVVCLVISFRFGLSRHAILCIL